MRDDRGVALPAVLLALAVLSAVAGGLAAAVAAGLRTASYAADGVRAHAMAEAGVEAALAQVCPDGRLPGGATQLQGAVGDGTFKVQLDARDLRLDVEGQYGRARRRLEVTYGWRPPDPAARAVFVGGDWRVDERTRVEGSVYTGGRLILADDLIVTQASGAFGEGREAKVEAGGVAYAGGRVQA